MDPRLPREKEEKSGLLPFLGMVAVAGIACAITGPAGGLTVIAGYAGGKLQVGVEKKF